MKKLLILCSLTILCACGGEVPVCNPSNIAAGSCINTNGLDVSLEEIDTLAEVLETKIQERYPYIENITTAFSNLDLTVTFIDKSLEIECKHIKHAPGSLKSCTLIGGVDYNYRNIYVRYYPCLAYTSLAHEFLHSVEYYYLGVNNSEHDTAWFFRQHYPDDQTVTIEYRTMIEARKDLQSCQ